MPIYGFYDNDIRQVRIDTKIINKVLGCLTLVELEGLVQQVALAVENPSDAPLCEL